MTGSRTGRILARSSPPRSKRPALSRAGRLIAELRRRKVVRTALIYAALAWGGVEVVTTLGPVLGLSEGGVKVLVVAILAGLPVAVVLAWMFDLTPEGIRAESAAPATDTAPSDSAAGGAGATGSLRLDRPPPAATTDLIGRTREVAEVLARLDAGTRCVTITGPGGTGKTTLAADVARQASDVFTGGVVYFTLVGVPEAAEVVPTLAMALDVADVEGRAPIDGLMKVIGDRRLLLVLDNFEHVLDAAPGMARLLAACPGLQVLATSRAPLRIGGEQEFALEPLALPPSGADALDDVMGSPAVELFVTRARQARPDFRLAASNAAAVAAICRRLDGLPLALELAAARVRVLEPSALLQRLEHALDVLTSGARDLPERQRTLRATIDWSHSLLSADEQRLFRRLAVFSDGWIHDAAETVCDPDGEGDVLEEMTSLVEKGLVSRDSTGRFTMLQTILDFARERLDASGEAARFRTLHADYFRAFAERLERGLEAADHAQVEWMERGTREDGNLDAALAWFRAEARNGSPDAVEAGLRTCGALMLYWHIRAQHVRMRDAVDGFMEHRPEGDPTVGWAMAMHARAMASMSVGDLDAAVAEASAALRAAEELAFERGLAFYAWGLGTHHLIRGDFEEADRCLAMGAERCRALGWTWGEGLALAFHGLLAVAQGRTAPARERLTAAVEMLRDIGDIEGRGVALSGLALLANTEGDPETAVGLYEEARSNFATIGDRPEVARVLDEMAWCILGRGESERARALFLESLREHDSIGSPRGVGLALMGLAAAEVAEDRVERGLVVSAAADAFSEKEGVVVAYPWVFAARERLAEAIATLPEDRIARLTAEGRGLSAEETIAVIQRSPASGVLA